MIALELGLLRHTVLPHVVGKLVPALDRGLQRLRIKLADAPDGEDRRLDVVGVEQLDQAPDADAAAELALGELHRRLVVEAPQQHGVEVGGEVDGDARAIGPRQIVDALVAGGVGPRGSFEAGNFLSQLFGHGRAPRMAELRLVPPCCARGIWGRRRHSSPLILQPRICLNCLRCRRK